MNDNIPLYRIFPLKRFLQCLVENKLAFVDPIKFWDDTYEDVFSIAKFRTLRGIPLKIENDAPKKIFGMCWTKAAESDAMWRIYSEHSSKLEQIGIRAQTTVGKLRTLVESAFGSLGCLEEVDYLTNDEFTAAVIDKFNSLGSHFNHSIQLEMFSWKRKPFSHEEEVRIFCSKNASQCQADIEFCSFDPLSVFDHKLLVDPRINDCQLNEIIMRVEKLSQDFQVERSKLYDRPDILLNVDYGFVYLFKDEVLNEFKITEIELNNLVKQGKINPLQFDPNSPPAPSFEYGDVYKALQS